MLAHYALERQGKIVPLILSQDDTKGTGVMNPSIYNDNGRLLVNIRHVNYSIYHCHSFFHKYGPLQYIHEDHIRMLKTTNYLAHLTNDLAIIKYAKIDTSELDQEPQWEFAGLEDGRLVRWNGNLYLIGVRRDNNTIGSGRMEMSHIDPVTHKEISREIMPAPGADTSYCEKNWMPVLNRPNTFIKWTLPTEVVTYQDGKTRSKLIENSVKLPFDLRGGSQVLSLGNFYIAAMHEAVNFRSELGQKDAVYKHRFVVWDHNFNLVHFTEPWTFMGGKIEFCTGMCFHEDNAIISFGHQDNGAYLVQMKIKDLESYIWSH